MADQLPTSGFYQYEENESGTGRWVKLDLQEFDPTVFTDKSTSAGYKTFRTDISTPIKYLDINYTESEKHFNFGQIKIWKDETPEQSSSFNFNDTDRNDGGNISIDIKGSRSGTKSDYYNSDNKPIYYAIQEEIPNWRNYNYEIDYKLPKLSSLLSLTSYGYDPNYNFIYNQYKVTFDNNSTDSGYDLDENNTFNDAHFDSHSKFTTLVRKQDGKLSGKFQNDDQSELNLIANSIPPVGGIYIPNSHYHNTYTDISNGTFKPNFNLRSTKSVIQNGETVLKNYTNVNYLNQGISSYINLQIYWRLWGKLGDKFNGNGIDLTIPVKTTDQKIRRDNGDEDTIIIIANQQLRIAATLKSISTTPYEYNPETGKWDKEITDNDTVSNARINVEMNFSVESIAGYTLEVDVLASTQRS